MGLYGRDLYDVHWCKSSYSARVNNCVEITRLPAKDDGLWFHNAECSEAGAKRVDANCRGRRS